VGIRSRTMGQKAQICLGFSSQLGQVGRFSRQNHLQMGQSYIFASWAIFINSCCLVPIPPYVAAGRSVSTHSPHMGILLCESATKTHCALAKIVPELPLLEFQFVFGFKYPKSGRAGKHDCGVRVCQRPSGWLSPAVRCPPFARTRARVVQDRGEAFPQTAGASPPSLPDARDSLGQPVAGNASPLGSIPLTETGYRSTPVFPARPPGS
jgi:hypothetical protein